MSKKGNGKHRGKKHKHRLKSSTLLPDGPALIVELKKRWDELALRAERARLSYEAALTKHNEG